MRYYIKFEPVREYGRVVDDPAASLVVDAIDTNYPMHDNGKIDYLVDIILDWVGYYEVESKYYEFNTLEELWRYIFAADVTLDEEGRLHNDNKPAVEYPGGEPKSIWCWHGQEGLENFPDEALVKIGDQLI